MGVRLLFGCQYCDARPDAQTQRSLQRQVLEPGSEPYIDASPGGWLIWRGGGALGALGPRRYACRAHRGDLVAYLRRHYAAISSCVWQTPPDPQANPDTAPGAAHLDAVEIWPSTSSTFLGRARMPNPRLDDLLLALAAEFGPVDDARERLDDASRPLFGLQCLDTGAQAGRVSHAMRHELAVTAGGLDDPRNLMLDEVLRRRRGHPLLLAVVAVEIARRAGASARVCSSADRWFAGFGGEHLTLVELSTPARPAPAPETVRRHCSHEVAFGALEGLCHSYTQGAVDKTHAMRASAIRTTLCDAHAAPRPWSMHRPASERSDG